MLSKFENVDEIDLNRDIEDDRKGDSSGALKASSHLCGRQLQQPLMVHMVHTYTSTWFTWSKHINAHMVETHAISSYITGQMIKGKMMLCRDMSCVSGPCGRMGYSSIASEKGCCNSLTLVFV